MAAIAIETTPPTTAAAVTTTAIKPVSTIFAPQTHFMTLTFGKASRQASPWVESCFNTDLVSDTKTKRNYIKLNNRPLPNH